MPNTPGVLRALRWIALFVLGCGPDADGPENNPFQLAPLRWSSALASAEDGSLIAVGGDVIGGGHVVRVEPSGQVTTLATGPTSLVRTHGDNAYVASRGGAARSWHVARIPIHGGPLSALSAKDSVSGLAVDSTHAYWLISGSNGGIHRQAHDASTSETLLLLQSTEHRSELQVDATHLYWIGADGIMRMPKAGGPAEAFFVTAEHLAEVPQTPRVLADDEVYLYAAGGTFVDVRGPVVRLHKQERTLEVLARDQENVHALLVRAGTLYWGRGMKNQFLDYPAECDVVRQTGAGAPLDVLASGQNGIGNLALSGDRLYWVNVYGHDLAATTR